MIKLCEHTKCTGCYACYNVCPNNAISMLEDDDFGHAYPHIDQNKCVECKQCNLICPILNKPSFNDIQNCYAAFSKNFNESKNSSSGALAYEFSKYILSNNGSVYGAMYNQNFQLIHDKINTIEKIQNISGSKYVQSNIYDCYKKIEKDLHKHLVLFIGTPCQVAGLQNFISESLKKNLYTIDIVCHGVPSQLCLKKEVSSYININDVKNVLFRDQDNHDIYTLNIISNKNDKPILDNNSYYIKAFFDGYTLRKSCFNCMYAQNKRLGDITLGDFWGLQEDSLIKSNKKNGISLLLINTNKGKDLFCNLNNNITYEKRSLAEAEIENTALRKSKQKPKKYKSFLNNWKKTKSLKQAYKQTFPFNYYLRLIWKKTFGTNRK